jgi:hypothetical protein
MLAEAKERGGLFLHVRPGGQSWFDHARSGGNASAVASRGAEQQRKLLFLQGIENRETGEGRTPGDIEGHMRRLAAVRGEGFESRGQCRTSRAATTC